MVYSLKKIIKDYIDKFDIYGNDYLKYFRILPMQCLSILLLINFTLKVEQYLKNKKDLKEIKDKLNNVLITIVSESKIETNKIIRKK